MHLLLACVVGLREHVITGPCRRRAQNAKIRSGLLNGRHRRCPCEEPLSVGQQCSLAHARCSCCPRRAIRCFEHRGYARSTACASSTCGNKSDAAGFMTAERRTQRAARPNRLFRPPHRADDDAPSRLASAARGRWSTACHPPPPRIARQESGERIEKKTSDTATSAVLVTAATRSAATPFDMAAAPTAWAQGGTTLDEREQSRFELGVLLASGRELIACMRSEDLDPRDVTERYQLWYTQALRLVERVLPERLREFEAYYRSDQESREQPATISAILGSLRRPRVATEKGEALARLFDPGLEQATVLHLLGLQLAILASALPLLLPVGRRQDRGLRAARLLLAKRHRRAAGAVAGVVLESHLLKVAQIHDLALSESDAASLPRLNRSLRRAGVYGAARSRRTKRLAVLSDSCVCGKKISRRLVKELLSGVEETLLSVS
jgi:hypothetical protein